MHRPQVAQYLLSSDSDKATSVTLKLHVAYVAGH